MSDLTQCTGSGGGRREVAGDATSSAARPELLPWFTTILVVITCLYMGVFVYPLQNWRGAAVLAVVSLAGLLTPLLHRWSGSMATATHYFGAITFTTIVSISAFTGGLYSPAIAWLATVPLATIMLSGPRIGGIWMGAVAVEVLLISQIAPAEFARTQTLSPDEYRFLTGLSLLGLSGGVFAALLVNHLAISTTQQRLTYFASHDGLTGLLNHRALLDALQREAEATRARAATLSLIMIDVDYFKSVNDRFGHLAGDEALQETARRITACLRPSDYVGRYGGEEFLCILPDCSLATARHLAELTRQAIQGRDLMVGERSIPMTVSLGVVACNSVEDHDGSDALRRSDRALYTAKRCGRNRTCVDASLTSHSPDYQCELPAPARTMTVADLQECRV